MFQITVPTIFSIILIVPSLYLTLIKSVNYDNYIKIYNCQITNLNIKNICLLNNCDIFDYQCNYNKDNKIYTYIKSCYENYSLNCNINYNEKDIIGQYINIGLSDSSISIVIYFMLTLSILLMVIILICSYNSNKNKINNDMITLY